MAARREPKPVILVSSSVYGIEELLEQIFAMLNGFGYQVWMSFKGTLPVDPQKSNFDNCLAAVEKCDLFLGVITPFYGTGKQERGLSITHREMLRAIELDKLRWFLTHAHIPFARQLLKQFRFQSGAKPNRSFVFQKTGVMDDIRVLDMYEAAIRHEMELEKRTGNWVQEYFRFAEALEFVSAQFGDLERIQRLAGRRRS